MTIEEVIAELEKASEGSRELSDAVLLAAGWKKLPVDTAPDIVGWWDSATKRILMGNEADPTRSLDAAMTLVSEGLEWAKRRLSKQYSCILKVGTDAAIGLAPTEALAICIASLRARSRQS